VQIDVYQTDRSSEVRSPLALAIVALALAVVLFAALLYSGILWCYDGGVRCHNRRKKRRQQRAAETAFLQKFAHDNDIKRNKVRCGVRLVLTFGAVLTCVQ
jgi:hypothetical protein